MLRRGPSFRTFGTSSDLVNIDLAKSGHGPNRIRAMAFFRLSVRNLGHNPGANGFAAFAQGEPDAFFDADRFVQDKPDLGLCAR